MSVAIVTGASSGIGKEVARQWIARGHIAVLVARTEPALKAAAEELGPNAVPWPLDVSDLGALAALPEQVVARCGALDLVVNNAGVHHRGVVMKQGTRELVDMVVVNLAAPIVLCRAALPHLGPSGAIVNVTSLAGRLPLPEAATYSATKAGLRFFTRALAEEHPEHTISCVSPGPVDTPFFTDLDEVSDLTFSQPMSTAAEVAEAVLSCLGRPSAEICIPAMSGRLTMLGYLVPGLSRALRPMLKRTGARRKAAYARERAARP